jgi:hypothetical protein
MSALVIVVVLVAIVLVIGALVLVVTRGSRATRGGVEHPASDKQGGDPPFESIERHGS